MPSYPDLLNFIVMPLTVGDKLGPYEILALLGAGVSQTDEPDGGFDDVPSAAINHLGLAMIFRK